MDILDLLFTLVNFERKKKYHQIKVSLKTRALQKSEIYRLDCQRLLKIVKDWIAEKVAYVGEKFHGKFERLNRIIVVAITVLEGRRGR